jgi:hypothetical protein
MDHEDLGANGVRRREKKKRYLLGTNVSLCVFVLRVISVGQFRVIPTEVTEVPVSSATWPSCVDGTNARKVNS